MKKAFITGITGQDGSYLAELLLEKGYQVYGFVRRVALEDETRRLGRIKHLLDDMVLIPGSLESYSSIYRAIERVKPDEIYHLGAQSFVAYSFEDEFSTLQSNIAGTHYLLSSTKDNAPDARFYFAGSSEMFGRVDTEPQTEKTRFHPRSAYGISKVAGFHLSRYYREAYNLFASGGILYNHESPRRGTEFVTRKVSSHAAQIKLGLKESLELGNLEAKRDWGHARDYVLGMWLMLQQDEPDDYILCTGETHSVRELCRKAFSAVDLNWEDYVRVTPKFYRPAEVDELRGDSSKAREKLGWEPTIGFDELVEEMVRCDLELFSRVAK